MSPIYARFLDGLTVGAHILDAGCGSGRDACAFADRGFAVSAFDASAELAKRASAHCGFEVEVRVHLTQALVALAGSGAFGFANEPLHGLA